MKLPRDASGGTGAGDLFVGCLLEGADRFGWRVLEHVV